MPSNALRHLALGSPLIVTIAVALWVALAVELVPALVIPVVLAALPLAGRSSALGVVLRGVSAVGMFAFVIVSIASVGILFIPSFALLVLSALALQRDARPRRAPIG